MRPQGVVAAIQFMASGAFEQHPTQVVVSLYDHAVNGRRRLFAECLPAQLGSRPYGVPGEQCGNPVLGTTNRPKSGQAAPDAAKERHHQHHSGYSE